MLVHKITPILNVSDVPKSLAWFEKIGWKRGFTWNLAGMIANAGDANAHGPAIFAAARSGASEIFMCLDGQGSRGQVLPHYTERREDTGGVWMSWWLSSAADVDAAHEMALKHGVTVAWPPQTYPWGVRECGIVHPDGHTIRLSAGADEEHGP